MSFYNAKYATLPYTASKCSLNTTSGWATAEQCDYLSHLNYKLVNEVNEAETQKHFFKNKLQSEYRTHTCEMEELYAIISQKNDVILHLEETLDKIKKDYRSLEDECACSRQNAVSDKEFYEREMENMRNKCQHKIQAIQEQLEKDYELKLGKRIAEVERECEDRVKMYKGQIQQLSENSNQLTHELKLMQDKYRDLMLKNDTIIQQSINRELRKRDFEAQNNYLRDVSQYEAIVREKRELKEELEQALAKIKLVNGKNNQLEALLEAEKTKYEDLEEALTIQKKERNELEKKHANSIKFAADTAEIDVNTDQAFVPIAMPVDYNLISQIVSFKEFVVEKIVERFLDLFCKTAVTDPKKKSHSLTTFKNSIQAVKGMNPQIKILLYFHSNLQRIVKVYCPAMTYSRQYLTVKDDFLKRTLMECQTLTNAQQKLYRILELIHRLRHPITHCKSQISPGELRMVEIKLLLTLKKVFNPQ